MSRYDRFEKIQNLIPAENSGRESNEREEEQLIAITQQHSTDHESVTSGDQGSDEDQFEVHAQHSIDQSNFLWGRPKYQLRSCGNGR